MPTKGCLLDRCVCSYKSTSTTAHSSRDRARTDQKQFAKMNSQSSCICIPRLDVGVKKEFVYYIFKKLKWGDITNISFIVNQKNPTMSFVSIFVDIRWFNNEDVGTIRKILSDGNAMKIVHNNFNVWKIYEKKNNIHIHNN